MDSLSNLLKKSEVFQIEFDKLFPDQTFNKVNILKYITTCTEIVLTETRKKYPQHNIRFINPVFIVSNEIYPASDLPGDSKILQLTRPFFNLLQAKIIMPLSIPMLDNLLSGVCLFYGHKSDKYAYKLFKAFDLDSILSHQPDNGGVQMRYMIDEIIDLKIDLNELSGKFNEFSRDLLAISEQEKMRLVKTMILYRDVSRALGNSLVLSFVNRYNQTHSFFDCVLTFISEHPFEEDELLDFAHITESISLPIANYDHNKSKGISAHTMAKRNSLKSSLINSFKTM